MVKSACLAVLLTFSVAIVICPLIEFLVGTSNRVATSHRLCSLGIEYVIQAELFGGSRTFVRACEGSHSRQSGNGGGAGIR